MTKIEWAPVKIPPRRRMQTFTVGVYVFLMFAVIVTSYLVCGLILLHGNIYSKALVVAYAGWIYFNRHKSQNQVRGSGVKWMRDNFYWKHFRDYFPVELVKTAELPPNRNYLLACYPHGVAGIGVFTNMGVDISHWNKLFPKVRPNLGTLALHFTTPLWRQLVQAWGMISVTRTSLLNNLTTSNDANDPINADGCTATAVALVVGGAEEALDARPGKYILTIRKRKGFIKLAMRSGAAIVPVFSFGEVDIFDQIDNPPDSLVRKMQIFVKKATGISPPLVLGRGFFQYNVGLLPHRRRIVQVVGAPIDVPKTDNPKEEEVDQLHQKFMDDLNALFETHKAKYIANSDSISLIMK